MYLMYVFAVLIEVNAALTLKKKNSKLLNCCVQKRVNTKRIYYVKKQPLKKEKKRLPNIHCMTVNKIYK